MEKSPESREYHGNCHCGLFQFKLNIASLTTVWTCNCSICSRNGYLWIYPVAEDQLTIIAGEEKALHVYEFAMRGTKHLFCPECGSSVMARRRDVPINQSLRINARMLEDIDLSKLEVKGFSGAQLSPKYKPAQLVPNHTSETQNGSKCGGKFKGNCHCGQYKFSINTPELKGIRTCNCSICTKVGYMWLFPVADEDLIVEDGEGSLRTYEFGEKAMTHYFCPKCGSSVLARRHNQPPGKQIGINIRVLKDIDLKSLGIGKFPGADLDPKYQPPTTFPALELSKEDEGLRLYNGNCHCGAITYTVKTKPFSDNKVMSCNCSLCSRNSDLWIYPPKTSVKLEGEENLIPYAFLSENCLHSFCGICGVSVLCNNPKPEDEDMPLNVRTINGIDLEKLTFTYYDGKNAGPEYAV